MKQVKQTKIHRWICIRQKIITFITGSKSKQVIRVAWYFLLKQKCILASQDKQTERKKKKLRRLNKGNRHLGCSTSFSGKRSVQREVSDFGSAWQRSFQVQAKRKRVMTNFSTITELHETVEVIKKSCKLQ